MPLGWRHETEQLIADLDSIRNLGTGTGALLELAVRGPRRLARDRATALDETGTCQAIEPE